MPPKEVTDAFHIATASVAGMDVLLTWNCRHMANPHSLPLTKKIVRMGIVICRWQDHIEFRNPGLLRLSKELAVKGWSSDCRNKTLQKMFQFLGYSEKAGSGFPKIFMGTDEQHWERPTLREDFQLDQTYLNMPTVDMSEDSPTANIGAEPDQKTGMKTGMKTADEILRRIEADPSVSMDSLSKDLGKARSTIQEAISRLRATGLLRRVGPDKGGHWEIVTPQPPTVGPGS